MRPALWAGAVSAAAAVIIVLKRRRKKRRVPARYVELSKAEAPAEELRELANDALGFLAAEGVMFIAYERQNGKIDYGRSPTVDPTYKIEKWTTGPVALLPAPISASLYLEARRITASMVRLLDAAATDFQWLQQTFGKLAEMDDWTRQMLELAKLDDGGRRLRCHCVRADFMIESGRLVTIEMNPYAASLAGQAVAVSKVHDLLLKKYCDVTAPTNGACDGLADGLADAANAYDAAFKPTRRSVVAFVTVAEEDNELDHRKIERSLLDRHGRVSRRVTIADLLGRHAALDAPFVLANGDEVAVCYFRLCNWERYGDDGWQVRASIARSRCVEVPSAAAHLASLKRSQVEWSSVGIDSLALSPSDKRDVLACAAPQFALDDPLQAQQAVATLDMDPAPFVAKPARDGFCGGAPHIFDKQTITDMAVRADKDAAGWIVQRCAQPTPRPSLVLDPSAPALVDSRPSIPELGIYGVALHAGRTSYTRAVGHLVRSKHVETKDGGICRGNAVLDSPLLVFDGEIGL